VLSRAASTLSVVFAANVLVLNGLMFRMNPDGSTAMLLVPLL
jgi:hypothetical protein